MELTAPALWLTNVFFPADYAILKFFHGLAESAGGFLSPVLGTLTLTAWKGIPLIILALIMVFFPKTRRTGMCALLAMAIGALFTNLIVKVVVARPRPYVFNEDIRMWWEYVGSHMESDFSFPSGHMTAATAFTTAFVLVRGRRWLPVGVIYVVLMGASRMYLEVHYPSDVLGGFLFGLIAGIAAYAIIQAIYRRAGQTKFLNGT